jgi:hypothetical protein
MSVAVEIDDACGRVAEITASLPKLEPLDRGGDHELAAKLRIEERELEAGGPN